MTTQNTKFLKNGTAFIPAAAESLNIHDTLPADNYIIQENPMTQQLYFDRIGRFEIPSKLYGDTEFKAKRILNTFNDRSGSTGVLLTGEKGSGKTLLAKVVSSMAASSGMPTIIINEPYHGDKFNSLIQSITQPCIIMFDEFEKVYEYKDQEKILTLLDGVFNTKKLFILTCNDSGRLERHLSNRPSRIFYNIPYDGLNSEFIEEYCKDRLNDKSHISIICKIALTFDQFNFDMLKSLVEEMNRYNEGPWDALKMLNASPENSNTIYDAILTINDKVIKDLFFESYADNANEFNGSPLDLPTDMWYRFDKDGDSHPLKMDASMLSGIDFKSGQFTYDNGNGIILKLARRRISSFSIGNLEKVLVA